MQEEIQYPQNLARAIKYVNQRWVFDEKNYPALSQLDEEKRFIFILKHIFLHMLKYSELKILKHDFANNNSVVSFSHEGEKQFFKLFISSAQYVHFLKIPISEIVARGKTDIEEQYILFIQKVAKVLEKGDHEGFLGEEDKTQLQEATKEFLSCLLCFESSQIPWECIGQYLK